MRRLNHRQQESESERGPNHIHRGRKVEKVLNLSAVGRKSSSSSKSPGRQNNSTPSTSSFDMLTRVFPFHNKNMIENVLEQCGGDVAKAVQNLVGGGSSGGGNQPTTSAEMQPVLNNHKPITATNNSTKSAFQPTVPTVNHSPPNVGLNLSLPIPLPPPLPAPPTPSSATPNNNFILSPTSWQRMMSYPLSPPTLLHPSPAAYLAAVSAAATVNPSSWLFHHYRLFQQQQQQQQQHQQPISMSPNVHHHHVCLPGGTCLQCQRQQDPHSSAPMLLNLSPTSTSSSSSSQSPPQQQLASLFSTKGSRHDLLHRS